MDPENRILQLIARRMGKAISAEESGELESLLKRYPEMHYFMEIMESRELDASPGRCDDAGKKGGSEDLPRQQAAPGETSQGPLAGEPDIQDPS